MRPPGASAPADPWGLVINGECTDRRFAYLTICITEVEEVLTTCLASLCALLATTDPACVVAVVSLWVYRQAAGVLLQSGILPIVAPEWAPLPEEHPYGHLQNRTYTFAKLEAYRLTQYERVATFDPDVLFMRNASKLEDVQPFAAAHIPKGKDPSTYMNTGVMVIKPSVKHYNELVQAWREGDYSLHFSDGESTDQDVIIELCVLRGRCGPVSDLDACLFNHGSWLPEHLDGRRCRRNAVVARHNFASARETFLAGSLQAALRRGTCRARPWPPGVDERLQCWRGEYTREQCCEAVAPWGDAQCWGSGFTFERCCAGLSIPDSERLRRELRYTGRAWYGLSSQPDPLPTSFFSELCLRKYRPIRLTLTGLSMVSAVHAEDVTWWYPRETWQKSGPPDWVLRWAVKCQGLRAPSLREETGSVVMFRFKFLDYFQRHAHNVAAATLKAQYRGDASFRHFTDTMVACVPHECCMHQPQGTNSSLPGLRVVLWNFLVEGLIRARWHGMLPRPAPEDFEDIYEIDVVAPLDRKLCYRE